jgi:hypothetical protein
MRSVIPALLLLAVATFCPGQSFDEYKTGIELPPRKYPHPLALLAAGDGRLHLAWISGADRKGALYTAVFHEKKWSKPDRVLDLARPCRFVLFEQNGKPHLLECGSGLYFFAVREKGKWERLKFPLSKKARAPSVAVGPDGTAHIAYVAGVKRISRTARPGAVYETAGKTFLVALPAQGKPERPQGLDTKSQSRASRPVVAVDPAGKVHVVMERRYGSKAKPNIGYVSPEKPKSAVRVSRQPGSRPSLAAFSKLEMIAVWNDRPGVVESLFDGRIWNLPRTLVQNASDPFLHLGKDQRLHLVATTKSRSLYYLWRGPRGWSTPIDFGHAKGTGRVVEAKDGRVHLVWETQGKFVHRSGQPPGAPPRRTDDG